MTGDSSKLVLRGRILDVSRTPLAGLDVQAFDFDPGRQAQALGGGRTGEDGRFEIQASRRAAGGAGEGDPEVFLVVHSGDRASLVLQTGWVRVAAAEHDFGDLIAAVSTSAEPSGAAGRPEGDEAGGDGNPSVTPNVAPEPLDPSRPVGTAKVHGSKTRDFLVPRSPMFQGPFGRLFRELPAWVAPGQNDDDRVENIRALAGTMVESAEEARSAERDNLQIPAAYTYFGQFVDHDLTFDPTSSLMKLNDPEQLLNFRSPRFDLDNLYGRGPDDMPYLYDRRPGNEGKFVFGHGADLPFGMPDSQVDLETMRRNAEVDLPRSDQGMALIGDPRNDENIIVGQLQLAFLRLHNRMLDGALGDLRGFRPLPSMWTLDWARFLETGVAAPQWSRVIDSRLSPALSAIPAGPGGSNALAFLNLLRGVRVGLPSGQAVARAMGASTVWTNEQLSVDPANAGTETPLWLYILKEAEHEQQGQRLGWVGARIVAEVFVGLAANDPNSFLKASPRWKPETAGRGEQPLIPVQEGKLQLRDLLRHAGVLS